MHAYEMLLIFSLYLKYFLADILLTCKDELYIHRHLKLDNYVTTVSYFYLQYYTRSMNRASNCNANTKVESISAKTWIKIRMRNYRTFAFNSSECSASSNPADIYSWHQGTLTNVTLSVA